MIAFAALLALTSTTPAPAAAAMPAKAAAPARQEPSLEQRQAALRAQGFSAAGVTAILANLEAERGLVRGAMADIRGGRAALQAAAHATPLDQARFEQLMRDQEARGTRLTAQLSVSRLALLRTLQPADKSIYARMLVNGQQRPGGAARRPAAPAQQPQTQLK